MNAGAHIPDKAALLSGLPYAVIVLDGDGVVQFVNIAAEQFFQASTTYLVGRVLSDVIPADSPLFTLLDQVRLTGAGVSEYDVTIAAPRFGSRLANIQGVPIASDQGETFVILTLHEQSIARKIDRQLMHRGAARSMTAMAAILAHEIKNPLAGIAGAAQLLERTVAPNERDLTRLIRDEVDRICALVDSMSTFSDDRPLARDAVNIHEVLKHVRSVAEAGFARNVKIFEQYDPSLPAVFGNRDQLIQVFLNLLKNACDAAPAKGGEIVLGTAFQHGVRMSIPGSELRVQLPLVISVQDNGSGVPEDLVPYLFDPFVTTKAGGTGLGLALVAKIIDDHGGTIELENLPRRTTFKVMLPMMQTEESPMELVAS